MSFSMRTLLIALLVAAQPATLAEAQFPDLIEVSGQYMPGSSVENAPVGEAQVAAYDVAINAPIVLVDDSTFLIIGAAHHVDSISFTETPPGFVDLRALHSTELSLLFVQLLPHDWSLSIRLAPGIAGDYHRIDSDMLRLNSVAMASHAFSERFILGGGVITTYSFGSFLPLPALFVDWTIADGLRLEAFLPAFLWARWTLWNRLEIGARAEFQGNAYAVRDARIRNAYPCRGRAEDDPSTPADERQANPDACLDHFAYSVGSAGGTVGVRLFSDVWLSAYAGYTFFRLFEPRNAEDETLPDGDNTLGNDFVLRTAIAWRIPGQ